MIVIGGNTVDVLSLGKHAVIVYEILTVTALHHTVVVVGLQCKDAVQICKVRKLHTAPEGVIVCDKTAAGAEFIAQLLGGSRAVPGAVIDRYGPSDILSTKRMRRFLLHSSGPQNADHVMAGEFPSICIHKDGRCLQAGQNQKIPGVECPGQVREAVMFGEAKKRIAVFPICAHRLLRRQVSVRAGRVTVEISAEKITFTGKAFLILIHCKILLTGIFYPGMAEGETAKNSRNR
jgi:hypothetical protein